ncbi:unannotated protein [freshwater metagenome]|uniref:Unannotated protein n=1 Tax=freshwater metagenome TaxID=449393 RepID=A0A6J7JDI4_9ZZZZ|nr:alpha/beta hydrolase fold domain-containing protein [Actinomycetota bacterium]MSW36694.1 alpha/beta hydrolase fold domain-containing protein [Actinomycetota bacterium]MSX37632.1 alpha/beta hydrolase fold domain-containing protein [Actinomycetota bacterium]
MNEDHSSRDWPSDPHMREVLQGLLDADVPQIYASGVNELRDRIREMRKNLPPGPEVETVTSFVVPTAWGGVPVRSYASEGSGGGVIVYIHGGGWVIGGIDESDGLCRYLARESGHEVISVGYRLAPEHRFPAAIDDADAVVSWVSRVYAKGRPLALVGDSAGANLVIGAARRARDRGNEPIDLQVLVYPVTDHRMDTESYRRFDVDGLLMVSADMRWFWDHYIPDAEDRATPDASPALIADLAGLPPAVLITVGFDPLRDEGVAFAERLAAAGVPVTTREYPQMIHGFLSMFARVPDAADAMKLIVAELTRALRAS